MRVLNRRLATLERLAARWRPALAANLDETVIVAEWRRLRTDPEARRCAREAWDAADLAWRSQLEQMSPRARRISLGAAPALPITARHRGTRAETLVDKV
jgi:hypothetical protein